MNTEQWVCGMGASVISHEERRFTQKVPHLLNFLTSHLLIFSTSHLLNYSYFRESTGFERATLNDFALTTSKAIANTSAPGRTKSHQ